MANGWTPERRARQSALIRKWKPWELSTGAKTLEGKAISSQNAVKHGMGQLLRELREALRDQKNSLERCIKLGS